MPQFAIPLIILSTTAVGFAVYFHIAQKRRSSRVDQFFQAGRNIGIPLFTQTSWGSSFAFGNSIFYALWLGYTMGLSGLWLQALWAIGMAIYAWLLPRLVPHTENYTLHGFLGSQYGSICRVIASVISAMGLIILVGFELSFAAQYFSQVTGVERLEWLIVPITAVFFATFCSIGGFHANTRTDRISNYLAVSVLFLLLILVLTKNWDGLQPAFTPHELWKSATDLSSQSPTAMIGIGFFALFNIVDMTNWQTVSANSLSSEATSANEGQRSQMQWAMLRASGLFLIAPVLSGTLLGYMLKYLQQGTEDQTAFMSHLVLNTVGTESLGGVMLVAVITFVFVAASLSGVDSWSLATAQTVSWDLLDYDIFLKRRFNVRAFDAETHDRVTRRARITLLIVGVGGASGVYYVSEFVWNSVFALQFVIFGGGLSMLPALVYGLFRRPRRLSTTVSASAVLSVASGYAAAIVLFVASLVRSEARLVEPLPLVSLLIATVVFSVGLLVNLLSERFAQRSRAGVKEAI